jgi:hypothetical protein
MRKSALLLAVLLAASFATTADAARRRAPAPVKAMPSNEASMAITTGFIANMLFPPAAVAAQPVAAPVRHHRMVRHHKKAMKMKKT